MEIKDILYKRFMASTSLHPDVTWDDFWLLINNADTLNKVMAMEESGGEPNLVVLGNKWYVIDCFKEAPSCRTGVCYDREARINRSKFPPSSSAQEEAEKMGVDLLTEVLYLAMQSLTDFDLKTSSWLHTENRIREMGGAIFGDKRFNRTFIYHNGADSYYSGRGFRTFFSIN